MAPSKKPAAQGHGGPSDDVVLSRREHFKNSPNATRSQDFPIGDDALDIEPPKNKPVRQRALEVLERGPATAERVAVEIGQHFTIVRARCSGLRAMGMIEDSGLRGRGALGGRSIIWKATSAAERALWRARQAAKAKTGRQQ